MKYRISFVIPAMPRGGTEGQLIELLRGINRELFTPELVLLEAKSEFDLDSTDADVIALGMPVGISMKGAVRRAPLFIRSVARLAQHYSAQRPDITHCFLPPACMVGVAAAQLARVPVTIVGRRSMLDLYRTGRLTQFLDRLPLHFATAVIGNSAAITADTIRRDGFASKRAFTVCNGVNSDRFMCSPDSEARRALGFSGDHVVIGNTSNFSSCKRHIDLVHAAALVCSKHSQARFVMVGKDRGTATEVRTAIAALGLQSRVVVVSGTDEPEKFYRAIDIYVCSSSTEGLSNSILEAMACGKPVVATRVGGTPELVRDNLSGLLVDPFRPADLAAAIGTLVTKASVRTELGANARRLAETKFSISRMVREYESIYLRMLGAAQPVNESHERVIEPSIAQNA